MKEVLLSDLLSQSLSRESPHPLQRQIYEIVRRGVLDHTLIAGQKLPSSRALALELGVSRITVSLAYDRLIGEEYLIASSGRGTFVAHTSAKPMAAGIAQGSNAERPYLSHRGTALTQGTEGITQHAGAFVPGIADASMFPFHIWKRLVARYVGKSHLALAGYATEGAGFLPLRVAIANYLGISRSVACSEEQVIVTAGTHQSIDLCARLLTDPGDTALIENPCHWAFPTVLAAAGLKIAAAGSDSSGVDLNRNETHANARLLVTSPSHQYPLGVVMPLQRRLELLQAARLRNMWIIEDDYDSEFRYDGAPIPSLQGMDVNAQVIYMSTFSKAMFAGIRMSYMVVPAHMAEAFSHACALIYRPGLLQLQAAVADFISEGHFSHHIRRMRVEYGERQQVLRDALDRRIGSAITLSQARAGLHVFAKVGPSRSVSRLVSEARAEGIVLGMPHFVDASVKKYHRGVVLGYGGVATDRIDQGVERFAQAFERSGNG